VPADPESKGGAESTVKLAKADIVPTGANLLPEYASFGDVEGACAAAMERLNHRPHALTGRAPAEMLLVERAHLHRVPAEPYTVAFGESRTVSWSSTVTFGGARYSVPHELKDSRVWVRCSAEEVVVVAPGPGGAREVARHPKLGAGQASICDEHYPVRKAPGERQPRATNAAEAAFLALGEGAKLWLTEAAAIGTRGIEARMSEAVALAKVAGPARVDEALGVAAMAGRFSPGDLVSIVDARKDRPIFRADGAGSLQGGTSGWAGFGGPR
jgi:hypothetical protein